MVGTLRFEMCRNVPKRCVVSGVLVSSVLVLYIGFWTEGAPMVAGLLHLPTASWGEEKNRHVAGCAVCVSEV